jgi:hypothetical protein
MGKGIELGRYGKIVSNALDQPQIGGSKKGCQAGLKGNAWEGIEQASKQGRDQDKSY